MVDLHGISSGITIFSSGTLQVSAEREGGGGVRERENMREKGGGGRENMRERGGGERERTYSVCRTLCILLGR